MTFSINLEATDAISWNSCYVYVCSCALNMFKTNVGAADCEIRSVIRFWTLGMCYQEIHQQICQVWVTMRLVMAWLGNGFGCSMKDERTSTMRHRVSIHLWWMMIWCVRPTKVCMTTDVSQFLICSCTFLRFPGLYMMSVVIWVTGGRILWGGCTNTCAPLQ